MVDLESIYDKRIEREHIDRMTRDIHQKLGNVRRDIQKSCSHEGQVNSEEKGMSTTSTHLYRQKLVLEGDRENKGTRID